jgi:hypothetical protein
MRCRCAVKTSVHRYLVTFGVPGIIGSALTANSQKHCVGSFRVFAAAWPESTTTTWRPADRSRSCDGAGGPWQKLSSRALPGARPILEEVNM